jgi:hypothetical protein
MTRGPFLNLSAAGAYCGRPRADRAAARWARRHLLPCVPHVRLPGAGIVFAQRELDTFLARYAVSPLDQLPSRPSTLDQILGPRRDRTVDRSARI